MAHRAAGGPPRLAPGAPTSWLRAAASYFDLTPPDVTVLLGERAAYAGLRRRAPRSVGGTFRSVPAADGWFGLNLARDGDLDLVPALVEGQLFAAPWDAVAHWVAGRTVAEAEARTRLLGLAWGRIRRRPPPRGRPTVRTQPGAARPGVGNRRRPLVVDLSALWAGPLCAHLLGDAGARVIKVESWSRPDGTRRGPRGFFDALHARKESVALDLDRPDGLRVLTELVRRADVVIESSRPRALRQFGLPAEDYVARGTVWVAISAYGRGEADRVGFGDDIAASAGLVLDDGDGPYPVGDAIADPLAGVTAAAPASAALRSGRGWLLDVSMHDVAAAAARLVPDEAVVLRRGADWYVAGAGRPGALARVRAPRVRSAAAPAADLGAHTARCLPNSASPLWPRGDRGRPAAPRRGPLRPGRGSRGCAVRRVHVTRTRIRMVRPEKCPKGAPIANRHATPERPVCAAIDSPTGILAGSPPTFVGRSDG